MRLEEVVTYIPTWRTYELMTCELLVTYELMSCWFKNLGAIERTFGKFLYSNRFPVWWNVLERWSAFLLVGRIEDRKWRVERERERHTGQSELTNIFQTSSSYYSDDGISSKFWVLQTIFRYPESSILKDDKICLQYLGQVLFVTQDTRSDQHSRIFHFYVYILKI